MAEAPGIPMLGSQISLVSKSDVRYTGRLFNIDMQESTIALQSGECTCSGHALPKGLPSAK